MEFSQLQSLDFLTIQTFSPLAAQGRYVFRAIPKLRALENLKPEKAIDLAIFLC